MAKSVKRGDGERDEGAGEGEREGEKTAFLAAMDDRNLREVAEVALNAREVFLTDEQRSLLSRLCARVNSSRRSVTEWFYLLARDASGELLDSPSGGRFAQFAAMAEAEETVTMAMVRVPKLIRIGGKFDGTVATVVIPKAKGREATVLPMSLFAPREVGVRAALFMLQQYPLCFVETRRAGGAASV